MTTEISVMYGSEKVNKWEWDEHVDIINLIKLFVRLLVIHFTLSYQTYIIKEPKWKKITNKPAILLTTLQQDVIIQMT